MAVRATLFDGAVAEAREASLDGAEGTLWLTRDDRSVEAIDPGLLERIEGGGPPRFARKDIAGWRLQLRDEPDEALAALLPAKGARYGRWIDRVGLVPAAVAFAAVAGAVLLVGHLAPAWIAPLIPERWERDLGDAMFADFGDNRCAEPAGNRALARLAERVDPGSSGHGPRGIRMTALDINIFNAAALPGGRIVVFREMLTEADDEALAGVLAHEIAHVRRRHVTQALVRELGIGALIRTFAGGIGANAEQIVSLSYTRANEAEADRDSIAMMRRAHIDPRPTARLFAKLARDTGEGHGYDAEFLQSHPGSRGRAKLFADSYIAGANYRSALSPDDADALADVCWKRLPTRPSNANQSSGPDIL